MFLSTGFPQARGSKKPLELSDPQLLPNFRKYYYYFYKKILIKEYFRFPFCMGK